MIAGHINRAFIAKKVWRMQHINMQYMRLDPFPAVKQSTQSAQLTAKRYAKYIFKRMNRAHLIGDGTNAANSGDDIRRFCVVTATHKSFKKTRRLKDI